MTPEQYMERLFWVFAIIVIAIFIHPIVGLTVIAYFIGLWVGKR